MQTVYGLTPLTQEVRDWIDINIRSEPYQWLGGGLVIEHRYIGDIVAGLTEEGFLLNKDFSVS